jgi:uncharacterized protein YaaN involved in tellurite resistance
MVESLVQKDSQQVIDLSKLTQEERRKAEEIARQIDVDDSQAVTVYGVGAQREIADFSDTILREVRAKDAGYVGDILSGLVMKVKAVDVDSLSSGSFIEKIPLIGSLVNRFKRFITRYEKLSGQIEKIVDELDRARMNLFKDIELMDKLYDKNVQYLKNLDVYIAAGQIKLKELQETVLPAMQPKAAESKDPVEAQKYRDFQQLVNRFDKKLHDLMLSRLVAIQTSPQVRLIQGGDQVLVEKIQSSILNTIPLWKNQIVIAISLFRQKKALELQKEISRTTNELLEKNIEMLKESTLEIARESERGIVELATLKKVNADLISTIEETLKIQVEGKTKRRQAEVELVKLEKDLKAKLVSIKE